MNKREKVGSAMNRPGGLKERKEIEDIKKIRDRRTKDEAFRTKLREKLQKKLNDTLKKYSGLNKFISSTSKKSDLKVFKKHKKDLDKEYMEIVKQLDNIHMYPKPKPRLSKKENKEN